MFLGIAYLFRWDLAFSSKKPSGLSNSFAQLIQYAFCAAYIEELIYLAIEAESVTTTFRVLNCQMEV